MTDIDPRGGLGFPVEMQRGLTEDEIYDLLTAGIAPDLSVPADVDAERNVELIDEGMAEDEALTFLNTRLQLDITSAAFKFNPGQERWPAGTPGGLGGQWKDDGLPDVDLPSAPTGKVVKPAIIYKKHSDGAVVAQRDSRRLRWDAGSKKYAAEELEDGAWVEKQQLTKTAAYSELKEGDWREPGASTPVPRATESTSQLESKPEIVPEPDPASSPTPELDVPVVEPAAETETSARFNLLDAVRRDSKIQAALHADTAFRATHGFGGVPNDTVLEALAKRAGFTHKPRVRDRAAVDSLIESGSPELLRAFRTEAARDNFSQGDYYGAIGTEGNGTYFHFRPHDYDPIYAAKVYDYGPGAADRPDEELAAEFDETVEKMYTRLRKRALIEQNRSLENTLRYGEFAIRGALHPDTDIKSLRDDVLPAQQEYLAELRAERNALTDPDEIAELDLWIKAMQDEGRFAAATGIPAYYSTTSDELVVLDRGSLVIQDEAPRLATADDLVPTSTSPSAPTPPETVVRFDSPTSTHVPLTEAQREIDSRIRTAFRALQGRTDLPESTKQIVPGKSPQRLMREGGYVGFADLRAELSDIPREQLDEVLIKLASGDGDKSVFITPENAQFGLLQRDRDAALIKGNQPKHWLKIMPDGLPPKSDSTAESAVESAVESTPEVVPGSTGVNQLAEAYTAGHTVEKELTGGNTADAVELLTLSDGTRAVRKRGRPAPQLPEDDMFHPISSAKREYLAARIANALGINDVHTERLDDTTVLTTYVDGDVGQRAIMKRVEEQKIRPVPAWAKDKEAKKRYWEAFEAAVQENVERPGGKEIGLLDWLIMNRDRREANWLRNTEGVIKPIDHGNAAFSATTFTDEKGNVKELGPASPFANYWLNLRETASGVTRGPGKPKFTKSEIAGYREKIQALRPVFAEQGQLSWLNFVLSQLDRVDAKAAKE